MTTPNNRPIAPHLSVYKLPLTGIISISHRITGVMLSLGLVFFVYAVSAIANGESAYLVMQSLANFWLMKLLVWGFVAALFFHLCHGIRHLFWDAGQTFAKQTLDYYAKVELIASGVLTLITLLFL